MLAQPQQIHSQHRRAACGLQYVVLGRIDRLALAEMGSNQAGLFEYLQSLERFVGNRNPKRIQVPRVEGKPTEAFNFAGSLGCPKQIDQEGGSEIVLGPVVAAGQPPFQKQATRTALLLGVRWGASVGCAQGLL